MGVIVSEPRRRRRWKFAAPLLAQEAQDADCQLRLLETDLRATADLSPKARAATLRARGWTKL